MSWRLGLVAGLAAAWLLLGVGRLIDLQVLEHQAWADQAESQHQRVLEITPARGTIYDAQGRELAVSVEVESAVADPSMVVDPQRAVAELDRVLGFSREEEDVLLRRLSEQDKRFAWVGRQLEPSQAQEIRELELPGIFFLKEYKRYYPMGRLAAQVLGITGVDGVGLEGLELRFDEWIGGELGQRTVRKDARRGKWFDPALPQAEERPGQDLRLTLDASLQFLAERELARVLEEHRARSGTVVVLEPTTGAVLAMASAPSFDPNHYREFPVENRRNRVIAEADVYEPGSTFKLITAAAALEANRVDPSDLFDCGMGKIVLDGVTIRDHTPFGVLSFREVISRSSNIGTIKASLLLSDQHFYDTMVAFGFGRPTGVDLPGESRGLLRPVEHWPPLAKAYMSFGQALGATPLQVARAFAVVANGGALVQPYVVDGVGHPGAWGRRGKQTVLGRPVTPATVRQLERMLEGVVEPGFTGQWAAIPGYRVAGKTGTAEKVDPQGGYSDHDRVASFAGFVPARDPRLVALVVIDTPNAGVTGGGAVAAPAFAEIAGRALHYLGVPSQPEAVEIAEATTGAAGEIENDRVAFAVARTEPGPDVPLEQRIREALKR